MVDQLRAFREKHGHSLVTETSEDAELYRWTLQIRRNYRHQVLPTTTTTTTETAAKSTAASKRKISTSTRPRLSVEKIDLLQQLDFAWDVQSVVWDKRYQDLLLFCAQHQHCRVPPKSPEFPRLAVWVRNQRREYKRLERGEKSTLTADRLQKLRDLDFAWYRSHKDSWESRHQELTEYHAIHGQSNVPENYEDNFPLGQWCMNQRTAYKRYADGKPTALTPDRIQLLEAIDFKWNYREHRWYSMQERLKQFHELHGHVHIAPNDETNRDLRGWLILQRYHYNRKTEGLSSPLTTQRIQAMEKTIPGFSWKARNGAGPSNKDWGKLFDAMRDKGIQPGMRPKQHWFEGVNPLNIDVKEMYTEQDLLELWNQDDEGEEDDGAEKDSATS
jgi:hypothetical protein